MNIRRLQVIMILFVAAACAYFAAVSFAGQAANYTAEQEGKQMYLAQTREDMSALRACLMPLYRPAVKPELAAMPSNVSMAMPQARMMPSLIQPDPTAIAASPRPEIMTASEDKK